MPGVHFYLHLRAGWWGAGGVLARCFQESLSVTLLASCKINYFKAFKQNHDFLKPIM